MKKLMIIISISILLSFSNIYAKNIETTSKSDKKTVLEKLNKKDKLNIIYVSGAVILVASTLVLIPIIKEKRK